MVGIREFYESGAGGGECAEENEERIEAVHGWSQGVSGLVVDIGSADGRLSARLKGPGRQVIGVDCNGAQLERARERLDGVKSFDITSTWPFVDGELAAVHMGAVIEHVFDFRAMFAETSRVLWLGGLLWISVPNMACLAGTAWRCSSAACPSGTRTTSTSGPGRSTGSTRSSCRTTSGARGSPARTCG